jgi:hypothetical protein
MLENEDDEPCLLSNREILRMLVMQRRAFRKGDSYALFKTLLLCARYQAVIPEWATDELLRVQTATETGEPVDLNKYFGWKQHSTKTRLKQYRWAQMESKVVAFLLRRRQEGANFSRGSVDVFDDVAKELGLPRDTVIAVYDKNLWLKDVEPGNTSNIGFGNVVIPRGRRRGRPILDRSKRKKGIFA